MLYMENQSVTDKNVSFEDKLVKLEEIVAKMETGNLSLEEQIKFYKEGVELAAECKVSIEKAYEQVKQINEVSQK